MYCRLEAAQTQIKSLWFTSYVFWNCQPLAKINIMQLVTIKALPNVQPHRPMLHSTDTCVTGALMCRVLLCGLRCQNTSLSQMMDYKAELQTSCNVTMMTTL